MCKNFGENFKIMPLVNAGKLAALRALTSPVSVARWLKRHTKTLAR